MIVPMKMVIVNKFVLTQTVLTFVLVILDTDYIGKDFVQVIQINCIHLLEL